MLNILDELNRKVKDMMAFDGEVTEDMHLGDDLGVDSLDTTELRLHFEEILGREIPEDDEAKFAGPVKELVAYLEQR